MRPPSVEAGAILGPKVEIGPFCMVGPDVELGEGVVVHSPRRRRRPHTVGGRTRIFPFASIGHQPQDLKYNGEPSTLTIGAIDGIREGVTINPGTEGGGMATMVGDSCAFLANPRRPRLRARQQRHLLQQRHARRPCIDRRWCHRRRARPCIQFARVGAHAFIGGMSGLENDLIPYGMALGNRAHLSRPQHRRAAARGFSREHIHELRHAYRLLFATKAR